MRRRGEKPSLLLKAKKLTTLVLPAVEPRRLLRQKHPTCHLRKIIYSLSPPKTMNLSRVGDPLRCMLMEGAAEDGERALQLLQKAFHERKSVIAADPNPTATPSNILDPDANIALVKLNRADCLLQSIIAVLDPRRRPITPLPIIDPQSLDQSIRQTNDAVQKIINDMEKEEAIENAAKGMVQATVKGMKRACSCLAPFLKNFLAAGEKGSAVQQIHSIAADLSLDTNSQSLWFIIHRTLSAH